MQSGVDPAEWRRLLDHANAGELALDPEIGKGLDQVCDNYLDRLDVLLSAVSGVKDITGFGTFGSGQVLQQRFRLKASGSDQSMEVALQQHIDAVKVAKQVVAKAISNFVEADHQHGAQITEAGQ